MNRSGRKNALRLFWQILPLLLATVSAPVLGQDDMQIKRGRILFLQCQACHDTGPVVKEIPGVPLKVGPNLHCLQDREAGTAAGYEAYSDGLKASGSVWTAQTLDQWLRQPTAMVPGTTMASFAGIASDTDRSALVSYLLKETECEPQDH